jgi:hypothetical protein
MDDDYILDEDDDEVDPDAFIGTSQEGALDEDDDGSSDDSDVPDLNEAAYEGKLSKDEIWLIKAYDDIARADGIQEAATVVVTANPQHTSTQTINSIIKDLLHKQGHSRMQNIRFTPGQLLRGEDVDMEMGEDDDGSFNTRYAEEARQQIDRFIAYLAGRDLSQDSAVSKRRKQRQIPAFIILLFSAGMFDLIINCPSMPKDYQDQITAALKKISDTKYAIVEELAQRYEELGRKEVAARVREVGLAWFTKEPAEIKYAAEYRDLKLTSEDVAVYREYRSRFTNTSSAITLDVISDMIEVVIDPEKGISEKLRDKTRTEAINDVKKEYSKFVENEDPENSELAKKVIFKELK